MAEILNLFKPIGITPLQLLEQFKVQHPQYNAKKLGYIGKLDPMAKGVMIVMVDKANNDSNKLKGLPKQYVCQFFLGVSTDSYDILGLIDKSSLQDHKQVTTMSVAKELDRFKGSRSQPYPPFSGVKVNGKPLFHWARNDLLDQITIPTHDITVFNISLVDHTTISTKSLHSEIINRITKLDGDFRQAQILNSWRKLFKNQPDLIYQLLTVKIDCSSGTFVRSIINDLGYRLETGATVLEIFRTKYGNYQYQQSFFLKDEV